MLEYVVKFNKLPDELKNRVSTPAVMSAIDELEKKYGVSLATVIMRVMVGEISFNDLAEYFATESGLSEDNARHLQLELAVQVFPDVADQLNIDLTAIATSLMPEIASKEPIEETAAVEPMVLADKDKPNANGANFFFSAEDEEEIRQLTRKVDTVPPANKIKLTEERLKKTIEAADINFGSELMAERFKVILSTYLRGIRNKIDTRETLTKPIEAGGLGFDVESADKILSIADGTADLPVEDELKAPPKMRVPEDQLMMASSRALKTGDLAGLKAVGAGDLEYDLATELKKKKAAEAELAKEIIEAGKPDPTKELEAPDKQLALPTETDITPDPAAPVQMQKASPEIENSVKAAPHAQTAAEVIEDMVVAAAKTATEPPPAALAPEPIVLRRPADNDGKIRMDDIKYVPKTTGPIDELKFMDLTSFRRLDKETAAAINKIKNKIKVLEDESYGKRIEAIKAWRMSPVNRLYLEIGETAMGKNQPIDIIIEERRSASKEYLSSEEFEAIMNLNRELRF
jgi:hypothetical protein